ncbi:MAG: thioredoxin domain-containing protein [Marinilabiliaceae bacterium]|jgi:thioredoxin|nr:thioredoxin domain-containing protein [Marinilabiliaceae bacterium]
MKKSYLTLAVLILSFSLISCGNNTASAEGVKKDKSEPGTEGGEKSIHLTKSEFLEKVFNYEKNSEEWKFEGDIPCIVDFYADWCQPCKIAGPILEELAVEYEGRINVYKIDTEKERELAAAFGIRSIPTFMLCPKEGQPQVFSGIGQTPEATKEMFKKAIDDVLLKTKNQ